MRGRTTKPEEGQTVNSTYVLKSTHTPTNSAWFFWAFSLWEWMGGGWGLLLSCEWLGLSGRALSGSRTNTVTWMFVPLYLVITWFSPPSASAAAGAWRSSGPWSWRWKWQSSRPWPAPPSRTPTTASSHPGKPKMRVHMPLITNIKARILQQNHPTYMTVVHGWRKMTFKYKDKFSPFAEFNPWSLILAYHKYISITVYVGG